MKREVLLLGDPALYEVSAAVTRGELEQLRPDIEAMFECLQDAALATASRPRRSASASA